ncbi:SX2_G0016160.mRNA.1.CDS.1 [Saccharomyces cerevisiae]|nr:SX2_G0016160.mRNA.1.CDS.1 [Saccharomyces cerevisiae]
MESISLHTNITIIPHSVLYVSLSYYIINPCTSASVVSQNEICQYDNTSS